MKKISVIIFAVILFTTANSQTKSTSSKVLTAQDSAAMMRAEVDRFIDSTVAKTTIKEFLTWLDDGVSAKMFRESSFQSLWGIFIDVKYKEWMQRKQKKN